MKKISYWIIFPNPLESFELILKNIPEWMKDEIALGIEAQFFVKEFSKEQKE